MDEAERKRRGAALQQLAEYQRRGRVTIDEETINHMVGEESDRGLVIILASWIEDALADRIFEALPPMSEAQQKSLTKSGAPLKDFNARIILAKALGLIDDDVAAMLDVFRAMRNACSHSRHHIDFGTPELKSALLLLFGGVPAEVVENSGNETLLQTAFITAAGYVLGLILGEPRGDVDRRINVFLAELTAEAKAARLEPTPEEPSDLLLPSFEPTPTGKGR